METLGHGEGTPKKIAGVLGLFLPAKFPPCVPCVAAFFDTAEYSP